MKKQSQSPAFGRKSEARIQKSEIKLKNKANLLAVVADEIGLIAGKTNRMGVKIYQKVEFLANSWYIVQIIVIY